MEGKIPVLSHAPHYVLRVCHLNITLVEAGMLTKFSL